MAEKARLTRDEYADLLDHCLCIKQFILILEAFVEYAKENPYEFNALVLLTDFRESSPYALDDWLEALEYFYDWLSINQRQAKLPAMFSYISCVVENSPPAIPLPPLKERLGHMLDLYSFQ